MHTLWVGWSVPHDGIPNEHIARDWPPGMKGWCSGSSNAVVLWVGRVDAETPDEAWAVVLGLYGASRERIVSRWEPKEHDLGWRPGDRVPE